jgi:hypothetical protein
MVPVPKYIDLLVAGAAGSYPVEEAMRHVRELDRTSPEAVEDELHKAANWLVQSSGNAKSGNAATPTGPPKLNRKRLRQLQEA